MNENRISGIHHITAIASSPAENLEFYEQALGLRLVKQTVNFDDPYTYHLYYGDGAGSPGTILTFFPWKGIHKGKGGSGMIVAVSFAIPLDSMGYWRERLNSKAIGFQEESRFGESVIKFKDPHGLPLELIGVSTPPSLVPWKDSPVVIGNGIVGFHSATSLVNSLEGTQSLLAGVMGMEAAISENNRHRFKMGETGSAGHFFDVLIDPHANRGRQGSGTVHHIAYRTSSNEEQLAWRSKLVRAEVPVTEVRDRKYFKSIYFHEPGGVLFEIATDPPGFTVDEPLQTLGQAFKLPKQYERMREKIVASLPSLRASEFRHEFWRPEPGVDDGQTIVPLHGTGGNEKDLLWVARKIAPNSAIISPRGKVLENGMPRFFRRLAEGVFDERDVVHRAKELSDFLVSAAARYGRSPEKLTALGYSNGANIAATILFSRPEVFAKALLLRPMMPLLNPPDVDLTGKKVLILAGDHDPVAGESGKKLNAALVKSGAIVRSITLAAGHEVSAEDISLASEWLRGDSGCKTPADCNMAV
jgi:predicted esterase/catechol 2,3-dioxygenase-like lactoylglutathione lyase family enzyme